MGLKIKSTNMNKMRKCFFYICLSIFVLSILGITNSCSKEKAASISAAKDISDSQLLQELSYISDSLASTVSETKGWSKKEWLEVICTDIGGAVKGGKHGYKVGMWIGTALGSPITGAAFGAFTGGCLAGAIASWVVSPDRALINPPDSIYYCEKTIFEGIVNDNLDITLNSSGFEPKIAERIDIDPTILLSVNLKEKYLDIGKIHNIILAALEDSLTFEKSINSGIEDSLHNAIIYSEEMKALIDEVKIDATEGSLLSENTICDRIISQFNELMLKYPNEINDVITMINEFSEKIEVSIEIEEEEKDWVYCGLATALYSYNYWWKKNEN